MDYLWLGENFRVIIEDIIGVLRAVDIEALFHQYRHELYYIL
ncbi:MAG: hypothetical protein N3E49_09400 [Bacteroidia bacterium]|nr:hypothetical protein [Bacteroidia bacterium]MDW8236727.1 hypothetical protein [Bacteroidia bacterium]